MPEPDPYATWSLADRLQMLAFEAELAHLPRSLIGAIWKCLDQADQWHATHAHSRVSLEECRPEIQNALQEAPGY